MKTRSSLVFYNYDYVYYDYHISADYTFQDISVKATTLSGPGGNRSLDTTESEFVLKIGFDLGLYEFLFCFVLPFLVEKGLALFLCPRGKGQLISKCLFGGFNSPKKRTKKFDFTTMVPQFELFSRKNTTISKKMLI